MHHVINQEFTVRYTFPVLFSRGVFDPANPILDSIFGEPGSKPHRLLAFVDAGVLKGMPDFIRKVESWAARSDSKVHLAAAPFLLPGGEQCKNDPAAAVRVQELIGAHHLCRQSFVMAIGGGAILDMVGYAAATAHRGVRLVRLPTTVLAQNDAGVGVKNGVNGFGRKNFIGTFAPPFAVVNDFEFLNTLPDRDLRAGIAEAVKVALIKDGSFFNYLFQWRHRLASFDRQFLEKMIIRCAELHLDHIGRQGDPFEFGSARPLDFGHWSAHKLEEITTGELKHGEAVAIGIALDSCYCQQSGLILDREFEAILTILEDLGLPIYHPALELLDVCGALNEFQEHLGGPLTLTLLTGLGGKKEVHEVNYDLMGHCIQMLAKQAGWRQKRRRPSGSSRQVRTNAEPLSLHTAAIVLGKG